jgi:hypothetical protein
VRTVCKHDWSPWWEGIAAHVGQWRVCRVCNEREERPVAAAQPQSEGTK